MKTFKQLREELNHQLDERAAIHPDIVNRLNQGIGRRTHNGHEGASIEHDNYADEHKGTPAGKFHAKAAMHHNNASAALKKGHMANALKHSQMAANAAAKAKAAGGSASGSADVHRDHEGHAETTASNRKYRADKITNVKRAARANPMKATIGKTVSKVKKMFRREDVEQLDELSPELMTRYVRKAIPQQFKKHQAARDRGHNYMTKTGGDDKAKKYQAQADRRKKVLTVFVRE